MNISCKAQSVGVGGFVRCLEDTPSRCSFAFPLGSAYFCNSYHRFQIAEMYTGMAEANLRKEELDQEAALSG